jgi:hypothetical protein
VPDGDGDLARGLSTLHAHRVHLDVKSREAASEHVQHVSDCGTGRTGDDGDPLRQHGDRFFTSRIEEAFIRELFLELFERQLQRAEAGWLHGYGIELELSLLFVESQSPANDELQSVLDSEAKEAGIRGKKDHAHLRAGVLDRKIKMSGSGADDVRGLSLDAYVVVSKEIRVDLTDELTYFPDALCHSRILEK